MMLALHLLVLSQLVSPVPGVQLQDEGTSQGQVTKLNFAGAGVACAKSGATGTCTIGGGGPGASNFLETSVTFDTTGNGVGATVVTGQSWVTATSMVMCTLFNKGTVTNNTDEVYQTAGLSWLTSTRVAGVGFTLSAFSPNGATGQFFFHCTGS